MVYYPQPPLQMPPPPPPPQPSNNGGSSAFIKIPTAFVWIIFGLAVIAIFIALVVVVSKTGSAMNSNMQFMTRTLLMNGSRGTNTYASM